MSNYPSPTEQEAMWFRNGERLRAVKSYRARVDIGIAACLGVFGEPPKTVIETEELNALRAEVATLKAEVATLKAERDGARHVRDLAIKDIGRMHGEIKALEASLASARAAAFEEAAKVADAEESRAYAQFSELPKSGATFDRCWNRRMYAKELAKAIRALAAK